MTKMTIILLFYLISSSAFSPSDKDCKVLMESISGSYDGACKKGLAEGTGTARGIDTYAGDFKKGLPHGMGRYIWANGNYYSGDFEAGKREGYGEMMIKREGKKDSLVAGYWTRDIYMGVSNSPYVVRSSSNVKDILFEKTSENGNEIFIIYQRDKKPIAAGGLRLNNDQNIKPATEFDYTVLRKVDFPFLGTRLEFRSPAANGVSIIEYAAEFDIFEKGKWQVTIEIE